MFIKTQSYLNFYCSQKLSIQYCIILVQQECNTPCKNLSSKWPDLVYFDLGLFWSIFTLFHWNIILCRRHGQNANLDQTLVQWCSEKCRFFMFEEEFITYWSVIDLQFLILIHTRGFLKTSAEIKPQSKTSHSTTRKPSSPHHGHQPRLPQTGLRARPEWRSAEEVGRDCTALLVSGEFDIIAPREFVWFCKS